NGGPCPSPAIGRPKHFEAEISPACQDFGDPAATAQERNQVRWFKALASSPPNCPLFSPYPVTTVEFGRSPRSPHSDSGKRKLRVFIARIHDLRTLTTGRASRGNPHLPDCHARHARRPVGTQDVKGLVGTICPQP